MPTVGPEVSFLQVKFSLDLQEQRQDLGYNGGGRQEGVGARKGRQGGGRWRGARRGGGSIKEGRGEEREEGE